jgi:6-phosphogluconolactonase
MEARVSSDVRMVIVEPHAFRRAAAERIAEAVRAAARARGVCHLALAGGDTPGPVYDVLSRDVSVPWPRVHVWFGDERAVDPDARESNYRLAHDTLLSKVPVPPAQVHRMEAERADRVTAAREYAAMLPERLDVLLLGVGPDGHVASLFPGRSALAPDAPAVLVVEGPKPPKRRMSIGPDVILRARETFVLVSGTAKAGAVQAALEEDGPAFECPARLARSACWIIDTAAAAFLDKQPRPAPAR